MPRASSSLEQDDELSQQSKNSSTHRGGSARSASQIRKDVTVTATVLEQCDLSSVPLGLTSVVHPQQTSRLAMLRVNGDRHEPHYVEVLSIDDHQGMILRLNNRKAYSAKAALAPEIVSYLTNKTSLEVTEASEKFENMSNNWTTPSIPETGLESDTTDEAEETPIAQTHSVPYQRHNSSELEPDDGKLVVD